jgi:hypothetical protein
LALVTRNRNGVLVLNTSDLLFLDKYEMAAQEYATCRYLETVGHGGFGNGADRLIAFHDRTTRCEEPLPLA